jgi:predicted nucleic acid-binding Zn ribbon protein
MTDAAPHSAAPLTCIVCGAAFVPAVHNSALCSDACKRERRKQVDRTRVQTVDRILAAYARNREWAREHRACQSTNHWLAGAPPYNVFLPGVSTSMSFDPAPTWPVELRNTRGLHGMLTAILDVGHGDHVPYWALRPWKSGWGVHWLHPHGMRFVNTTVQAALYDRPTTVHFGPPFHMRAPSGIRRGKQLVRLTTITPVCTRTNGGEKSAEKATSASLVGSLRTEFLRRIAPSQMWLEWVEPRIRIEIIENETHLAVVPIGYKYGAIRSWEGSAVLEVNAVARWLLEAASRIGFGSRVAFGFGWIRVEGIDAAR